MPWAGQLPILLTAQRGTSLPFDASELSCYRWSSDEPLEDVTSAV